jgi:hypothetical protein
MVHREQGPRLPGVIYMQNTKTTAVDARCAAMVSSLHVGRNLHSGRLARIKSIDYQDCEQ